MVVDGALTHHSYTNHAEKDPDSVYAEPMLLFNDYPLTHPARMVVPPLSGLFLRSCPRWLLGVIRL
jgi:hypothetical protein